MNAEDSCVAVIQRTSVERMNALGHLSPIASQPLTLARHLSGFGTPSYTRCAPGLGPLQGSTGPSAVAGAASTRGQLAAWLCCSWNLSQAHEPALAAVPGA